MGRLLRRLLRLCTGGQVHCLVCGRAGGWLGWWAGRLAATLSTRVVCVCPCRGCLPSSLAPSQPSPACLRPWLQHLRPRADLRSQVRHHGRPQPSEKRVLRHASGGPSGAQGPRGGGALRSACSCAAPPWHCPPGVLVAPPQRTSNPPACLSAWPHPSQAECFLKCLQRPNDCIANPQVKCL